MPQNLAVILLLFLLIYPAKVLGAPSFEGIDSFFMLAIAGNIFFAVALSVIFSKGIIPNKKVSNTIIRIAALCSFFAGPIGLLLAKSILFTMFGDFYFGGPLTILIFVGFEILVCAGIILPFKLRTSD